VTKFKPYEPEDQKQRGVGLACIEVIGLSWLLHACWWPGFAILRLIFVRRPAKIIEVQSWDTFMTGLVFWGVIFIIGRVIS
jgi:hypothetical protein